MREASQFKHVHGRDGNVESICMNCLLAVGICRSDQELLARESMHRCKGRAREAVRRDFQDDKRLKSMMVRTWNQLAAIFPERKPAGFYWPRNT